MGHFEDNFFPTILTLYPSYFGVKKYFPNGPYIIGNLMRYLLNSNIIKKGGMRHPNVRWMKGTYHDNFRGKLETCYGHARDGWQMVFEWESGDMVGGLEMGEILIIEPTWPKFGNWLWTGCSPVASTPTESYISYLYQTLFYRSLTIIIMEMDKTTLENKT